MKPYKEKTQEEINADFIAAGRQHCPVCDHDDGSGGFVSIEGDEAVQEVMCNGCGAVRVERYTFSAVYVDESMSRL